MSGNDARPESISAVTLVVSDMARSVRFYRELGFDMSYGGDEADFTSFAVGGGYLNLVLGERSAGPLWGRVIIYVSDVDAFYQRVLAEGHHPEAAPRDAEWGERYFHVDDPDGHQLSFARPLAPPGVIPLR